MTGGETMSLIKLAYISRATFRPYPAASGVEPTVGRILISSRRNNPALGVVGGLYYGEGCFFQYLEGEESAVRGLFETIMADDRHKDVKVVMEEPISALSFSGWSMKYVPLAGQVEALLRRNGLERFDPYAFKPAMVEAMIDLIHDSRDQDRARSLRYGGQTLALAFAVGVAVVIAGVAFILLRKGG